MTTIKSYTDLQQSKRLAEFLPLESADMYYDGFGRLPQGYAYTLISPNSFEYDKPCWSLAALLDVLPEGTRLLKSSTGVTYHCDCPKGNIDEWYDNPIDACYEIIIKLHEFKMLWYES